MKNLQIEGYAFSISNDGRTIINQWSNRTLAQCPCRNGYLRVWSSGHIRKRRSFMVHRIVALAYLECPEGYQDMDVNHKDGNKQNNHPSNLEWCTRSNNIIHAVKTGLLERNKLGRWDKSKSVFHPEFEGN